MASVKSDDARILRGTIASQLWRLNNLYWITDKNGKKIKFQMNWAQEEFFRDLHANNLILKARQLGFSTEIGVLFLDTAMFVANTACGVIAHTDEAAKKLFRYNIKYPYEHLPDAIRDLCPVRVANAHEYQFANDSSILVSTSMRSGTIQLLHISEFGKICSRFPERAREVVTGSLETVGAGNIVVIESTAEGDSGYFYEYAQAAKAIADSGKKPTAAEYKFFFFPWWREPTYSQPDPEIISTPLAEYFAKIEAETGQRFSDGQKYWYAAKRRKLGADCYREYPSTPDEAFRVSLEGTYYTAQLTEARQSGRVGYFPPDPRVPINTFWDIGISDYTSIWFHQLIGGQNRFVEYKEFCGEPLQHYVSEVLAYRDRGFVMGDHYMPWDAGLRDKKDLKSYADAAEELGLRPVRIVHTKDLLVGIQETRSMLATSAFDETGCELGLRRLGAYRKDWNERTQAYMDRPLHDESSHGADAIRMCAQGYQPPAVRSKQRHQTPAKCV